MPCYISIDKTGRWVLVATYVSGTVAVFPVQSDGSLGEATQVVQHTGSGPNPDRQEGPHAHYIHVDLVVYTVVLAAGFARDYYLQKKERQEETERLQARTRELEKQLTEAQLDALRMQLNPHFLFNTLHAISTLVGRDPQGVRRMMARLSELLRRVLDEEVPQEIPLADEAHLHVGTVDEGTGVVATIRLPYYTGTDHYAPSREAFDEDSAFEHVLVTSAAERN